MRVHYMGYILSVGLDVRVAGRHVEVQKGSQGVADWTLKQRKGGLKSKKEAKARRIGR